MITDPILLVTLKYIDQMTNPAVSVDEREQLNYAFEYAQSAGETNFSVNTILENYLSQDVDDLAEFNLEVHLWFWEQLPLYFGVRVLYSLSDRVNKFAQFYHRIPHTLLRYSIWNTVSRAPRNEIEEFLRALRSESENTPNELGVYDEAFIIELIEILLDLRAYSIMLQVNQIFNDQRIVPILRERRQYISGPGSDDILDFIRHQ